MILKVWAPLAATVAVRTTEGDRALQRRGYHWIDDVEILPGTDYAIVLDGGDPVPDPRSLWQPDGVHKASRVFDLSAFDWSDKAWPGRELAGGVIYELHLGTFTPEGTLDAAIGRLDHLVDLGIDFVELLPVNGFNGTHNWGYDGVLWHTVHEGYGGPAAYQRFVDACHARGLAVIQDVVYNHLGPSGNYLPRFGPYLIDAHSTTWGEAVNLAEPEVRRYILDNARLWLRDYHVDGLRLDAVHALVDPSQKHLLQELSEETDALSTSLGRPLTLIAESDLNDPKLVTALMSSMAVSLRFTTARARATARATARAKATARAWVGARATATAKCGAWDGCRGVNCFAWFACEGAIRFAWNDGAVGVSIPMVAREAARTWGTRFGWVKRGV